MGVGVHGGFGLGPEISNAVVGVGEGIGQEVNGYLGFGLAV